MRAKRRILVFILLFAIVAGIVPLSSWAETRLPISTPSMAGFFSDETEIHTPITEPMPAPPLQRSGITVSYLIEPRFEFDQVFSFNEGLAAAEIFVDVASYDELLTAVHYLGYINNRGEIVIPLIHRHYHGFYGDAIGAVTPQIFEGRAVIFNAAYESAAVFDRYGSQIVPFGIYSRIENFFNGRAVVQNEEWQYGVIDLNGNMIIPFGRYDFIGNFSEGLAAVRTGDWQDQSWGFIDTNGNVVFSLEAEQVGHFSDGRAAVLRSDRVWNARWESYDNHNHRVGFVDTSGNIVIPFEFARIYGTHDLYLPSFSGGLAVVRNDDNQWGAIDTNGTIVVPFGRYYSIQNFTEGLAAVMAGGWQNPRWGFVDGEGNEAIAPQFNRVHGFSGGLAAVDTGSWDSPRWGVIDRNGNMIVEPQYGDVRSFSEGLAWVNIGTWDNPRWGIIDRNGNMIVEPQYSDVQGFSEGLAWVNAGTRENPLWGILQIDGFAANATAEYDHAPLERPQQFEPQPGAISQVTDPESAQREIEDTIRRLMPEQRDSGDALSTVSLHVEQAERRGTTQPLPRGGSLDVAILRGGAVVAQDIRRSTENVLRGEGVLLQRQLRTSLNFETGERRSVAIEFPDDVADVSFDNLTIEAPFASATISREHISEGSYLQFGLAGQAAATGIGGTSFGERMSNVLGQERTFGEFLLTFWALAAIALMLAAYIIISLMNKRLRIWVLPTFIGLAIAINILTLWMSYDPDEQAGFFDGVIEVSMSEGMSAMLSLPTDGVRGNPENLVLFDERGEPQFAKHNPSTGAIDARIHSGGTFTLREHTVSFADIEDRSALMRQAVETLAARGIMHGVTDSEFAPDDPITRSEFVSTVVMAFDMLDLEARAIFADLEPAAWYYRAVATAEGAGIVHAYEDGTFRGDQNIRKDELTVVSANALVERMGYIVPTDIEPILARYLDRPEIESWAEGGVALATQSNVLLFRADGLFGPAGAMTRGDAAIVLYRLFNRVW